MALALGALFGALPEGAASRYLVINRTLFGRGYVSWQTKRWQAFQNAERVGTLLVVYRVDPRHGETDVLRERILSDPAVEPLLAGLSWHWSDEPTDPGLPPAAPELELWEPDAAEPVYGPVAAAELTPRAFLEAVLAARER